MLSTDADARYRPVVMGTHGMVSSGHPLVSLIAIEILKNGGAGKGSSLES